MQAALKGLHAPPGRALKERTLQGLFFLCGTTSVLITLGIVAILMIETAEFFRVPLDAANPEMVQKYKGLKELQEDRPDLVGNPWAFLKEFLTETTWAPNFQGQQREFGIWPLVAGTLMVTVIALLVALPLGLLSAVYLSEYASAHALVKPVLEILAGIPTVVYGYFALAFVTPFLQTFIPSVSVYNALSAGIVMGFMILPMVASLSEDAMRAVPLTLREGAYSLGATRLEVSLKVVLPAAFSGIAAATILAISRAIGETMIVTIAAGANPFLTLNPLDAIETMPGAIAHTLMGDTPYRSLAYRSVFAVGMGLFIITLTMNTISYYIVQRFRERYE